MSDPQLSRLLDRAVHHAPPMHLDGEHLLVAGRGRIRRRRVLGAGGGLAAAALVAAVWGGLAGSDGVLTGDVQIQPATTVWEQGESVDATLFSGYRTIDVDQVEHRFDGRLIRPDLAGPLVLELSDHGEVVERIPASSPQPGLEVFAGERVTVAVWAEPEGVVSAVPLVGPVDPGGPSSRTGTELDGERYGYSVWPADVSGVVLPEQVHDVYLVGEDEVVALSGAEVESAVLRTAGASVLAWADAERGVWGYAVQVASGETGPAQEPTLWPLGAWPAQATVGAWQDGARQVSVAILPEGAELGEAQRVAGDIDSTVLADRSVVLTQGRGEGLPDVHLTRGGREHTLDDYLDDLFTLDLPDGTSLPVADVADVVWAERSGAAEQLLQVSPAALVAEGSLPMPDGTVLAAVGWPAGAGVLEDARVELVDAPGSPPRWVTPHDVAQVTGLSGGVTLVSLDVPEGSTVVAVGLTGEDGVERWPTPVDAVETPQVGVDWAEVDGELVPMVDGEPLEDLGIASLGEARLYAAPHLGDVDLLVLPPGSAVEDHVLPLLRKGDSLDPAPWVVGDSRTVETSAGPVVVVETTSGMLTEGTLLAVRSASAVEQGVDVVWILLDSDRSGHQVIEGDLVVQASGSAPGDPWLMYPVGDDSWGPTSGSVVMRAGLVGAALLELVDESDPDILRVAAVLPEGSGGELVLAPGARLIASETRVGPIEGLELITAVVDVGTAPFPAESVGLDLDGDGVADLRLPARG